VDLFVVLRTHTGRQQIATPNIGGIFESRPGVQIKGERKLDLEEEQHNLSDLEEDGKSKTNGGR